MGSRLISAILIAVLLVACGGDTREPKSRPTGNDVSFIYGFIRGKDTKKPVKAAVVLIEPFGGSDATDERGEFKIYLKIPGRRCAAATLVVAAEGYGRYTWTNLFVTIPSDHQVDVDIERVPVTKNDRPVSEERCALSATP